MRTSESIVGTRDGVFRAGAIRRKPADKRWSAAFLRVLKGCPQQPVSGRDSIKMPKYVRPEVVGGRSLPPQLTLPLLLQMTPRESGAYMFEKKR